MGHLVQGEWKTEREFSDDDGQYKRQETSFRNEIGGEDEGRFSAEKGRYHLYVSYACPWAHRTIIFRHLKELKDYIDVSVVHPHMLDDGWTFNKDFDGSTGDRLHDFEFLHQIYTKAKSDYTGKVTVPILWDTKKQTIVNNESANIIRMFNTAFNDLTGNKDDYYPEALRDEINTVNERVYKTVNNGVYKTGFASKQKVYQENFEKLFESLSWLEKRLDGKEFLVGDTLTEADIRLFTTLIRFDPVYYTHFKCNLHHLYEYPNLYRYTQKLSKMSEIEQTIHIDHIKNHYFYSHINLNPHQIIPIGPQNKDGGFI